MARQSLTMQQNFNADELAEEKELFDNDKLEDNSDDYNHDWWEYEADQDSLDDFLNVEMAVYSE